ncbi:MAG: hypothetical protein H8D35_07500 [Nitrosopumilus sp.]|nr:hypothetical protein [Nitrosopumilus sp.]
MEVISEITSQHYVVFAILAIISVGIVSTIIFKNIQKYKQSQYNKKYNLNTDIGKIENALNKILSILYDLEENIERHSYDVDLNESHPKDIWKLELEIQSIRGIIKHQLGHIPRMRCYLK